MKKLTLANRLSLIIMVMLIVHVSRFTVSRFI